ncbi:MAG: alternative ribosome rescue aminoacyl-tRNA hydrolase ArfB, partial [Sediminispirochaetaceae bacterium]
LIPLPDRQKQRILERLEGRINSSGELVMNSSETRSQARNRELVLERAHRMILEALVPAKKRRPTRPTRASRERRLKQKKTRSEKKKLRKDPPV